MEDILFPFDKIRKGQDLFIKDVTAALERREHILMHALTGIGKTAILGPVLANAIKTNRRVFFVTPVHTQHKIAVEILRMIKARYKTDFVAVDLIGKKWMCIQQNASTLQSAEFSEYCNNMVEKDMCEFYLNVKYKLKVTQQALMLLKKLEELNPTDVEFTIKLCKDEKMCPFEILAMLAKKANIIVADYNHVLNPAIRENLFKKINTELNNCIIVIDEAHNLPKKSREMLSANISTIILSYAAKEAKEMLFSDTALRLKNVADALKTLAKKIPEDDTECIIAQNEFTDRIDDYHNLKITLLKIAQRVHEDREKSFCNAVAAFLEAWTGADEGFARILTKGVTRHGKPYLSLGYKCLDPSFVLVPIAAKAEVICMSGTLTPIGMYRDLFGFEAELKEYEDPFPKENRLNIIIPKTTTRYAKRNNEMYMKIGALCSRVVDAIPGNSIAFFPSYKLRDDVHKHFSTDKTVFTEQPGMSKAERNALLENFKDYKNDGAVLLATVAGSFSEGIDLPGDYLKGVVIVGLPLSKPDHETNELIKYYDKKFQKGRHYGYIYPAMLRTIQSSGRCIRSETDRGVIVFIDERYIWRNYYSCFPKWDIKVAETPISMIKSFFGVSKVSEG